MTHPSFLRIHPDGVVLSLKVQPRSSANQIGEALGNELRVKITAPPVDSAANTALIEFLAKVLDCPRSKIELLRGGCSRHKLVKIYGVAPQAILNKLK
jgi:uncharacterized protein (TIGR00251 family)